MGGGKKKFFPPTHPDRLPARHLFITNRILPRRRLHTAACKINRHLRSKIASRHQTVITLAAFDQPPRAKPRDEAERPGRRKPPRIPQHHRHPLVRKETAIKSERSFPRGRPTSFANKSTINSHFMLLRESFFPSPPFQTSSIASYRCVTQRHSATRSSHVVATNMPEFVSLGISKVLATFRLNDKCARFCFAGR